MERVLILLSLLFILSNCNRKSRDVFHSEDKIPKLISEDKNDHDNIYAVDIDTFSTDSIVIVDLEEPDTLIYYKQSGCFGTCPTYEIVIWENGSVYYNGHRYIKPEGKHHLLLDSTDLAKVRDWHLDYKLASLAASYPEKIDDWIPDLPSSTTIWKNSSDRGMIYHNHSAPKVYLQFEKFVYTWIKDQEWNPVPD